jgi:hypothetical protein
LRFTKVTSFESDLYSFEVSQRAKLEILLLKIFKNTRHLWVGHIIRHNEFVVNIFEGAISGKKIIGRPRLHYLKQFAR